MYRRKLKIVAICLMFVHCITCHGQEHDKELFYRLECCTKYFEGWHTQSTTPGYIGYGHQIQKGEMFPDELSKSQAAKLLRKDLLGIYGMFKGYGDDAYLLTALAYQIGPSKLLGTNGHSKSLLLRKLESGDRNIKKHYLRFCRWKNRPIRSIRVRRMVELELLYKP